jgi:hypothetical protein
MYYCKNCKRYFDTLKVEKEFCGVDNMSGIVEYCYCPLCDYTHSGEEYISIEEEDEDEYN